MDDFSGDIPKPRFVVGQRIFQELDNCHESKASDLGIITFLHSIEQESAVICHNVRKCELSGVVETEIVESLDIPVQ